MAWMRSVGMPMESRQMPAASSSVEWTVIQRRSPSIFSTSVSNSQAQAMISALK